MCALLSIHWDVNPEFFSLGPIHLRYYGVLMVSGFIIAYFVLRNIFFREHLSQQLFDSFSVAAVVSTFIGLRLGHFLFYQPTAFLTNPLEVILPVRFSPHFEFIGYQGLASHGGAVGILLGLLWWSCKHKKPYLWALERIVLVVPAAGALVRIGNLMNSEVYGCETTRPWGFIFARNGETFPHHPTQLYEAAAYLAIFFILRYLYLHQLPKLKRGMLFGIFLLLLFGARFAIEFIKNDQAEFEQSLFFNMGQLLSLPFLIAGAGFLCWGRMYGKPEQGWIPAPAGSAPPAAGKQPNKPKKR